MNLMAVHPRGNEYMGQPWYMYTGRKDALLRWFNLQAQQVRNLEAAMNRV
jgi:hypothetical protein